MSRLPLRIKLTAAFAVAMALVLVGTGLFVYLRLQSNLDETIDNGLRSRAADVTALVRQADSGLAESGTSPLQQQGESVAQILDVRGGVFDATTGLRERPLVTGGRLDRARRMTITFEVSSVPGAEGPVRLLATPVRAQDQRLIAIVGTSIDDRNEALENLVSLFLIGGPIALLLASGLGYGVAALALRPVESMRRRAAAISAQDRGVRLPVPAANDEISRLGTTLNDMLERLELAFERLELAFQRERTFVSDASHELRTPLAILKTELELALRSGRTVEELEDAVRSAADETDRLAQLAEDLLVIARSDQGKLPIRLGETDAADLLAGVRRRFDRRVSAQGRRLDVDVRNDLRLIADRLRLEQALANVVENAVRHGGGTIRLSAAPHYDRIEFSVTDEGPGFPPDFIDHAFERFTRADAARGRGGTGLGLAIVRAIATAHGGEVQARNLPGGGADVSIAIPAGPGSTDPTPADPG